MESKRTKKYIAFLRGINVGGNAVLPMSELKTLCEKLGLERIKTYIQSGNVIFESSLTEQVLTKKIEGALDKKMEKHIPVSLRTVDELVQILQSNPFSKEEPAKVGVMFFSSHIQKDFLSYVSTKTGEKIIIRKRELYIYYPIGMGRSKLKLPKQAENGTVRNVNTIQKLVELGKE